MCVCVCETDMLVQLQVLLIAWIIVGAVWAWGHPSFFWGDDCNRSQIAIEMHGLFTALLVISLWWHFPGTFRLFWDYQ